MHVNRKNGGEQLSLRILDNENLFTTTEKC